MKFTKTHKDWNGEFLETITIETKDELHIDEALEAFGRFLKASGYHYNGEIQIVCDEDKFDPLEDTQDWNLEEDWDENESESTTTPKFEGPFEGIEVPQVPQEIRPHPVTKEPWPYPLTPKP